MQKYIIEGGAELSGTVRVSGSKNAALPVIFATLVTHGVSEIYGLPEIEDVRVALELVAGFGAVITRQGGTTYVDTRELYYSPPSGDLVCRLRASTYLIGACLSRFGVALTGGFGGCSFSLRPIDMHISAMLALGAYKVGDRLLADRLSPAEINFRLSSVGATVNALIACSSIEGESVITSASREPHIDTLIEFLSSAGAEITVCGGTVRIRGTRLTGGRATIPGDMIEAGTFLTVSAMSGGRVGVAGANVGELSSFLTPFLNAGMTSEYRNGACYLSGAPNGPIGITTAPYPGFPTDLQPIAAPLLAVTSGGSICDTVWQGRFGYLKELNKMGLGYKLFPSYAKIYKSTLFSSVVTAPDLRGGAALVIAALYAKGKTTVLGAELLSRGYEKLETKLLSLGARVKFVENT